MTPNEITLEKFLLILRMHARLIAILFGVSVLSAVVMTLLTPNMYTASATLNFDMKGINPLVDNRGSIFSEASYITTQIGIINSNNVAQEVEQSLTDYERDRLIESLNAQRSFFDRLSTNVTENISSLFSGDEPPPDVDEVPTSPIVVDTQETTEQESLEIRSAYNWLVRRIGYDLSVQPIFNTRIVEISYTSTDRQIAALMADRYTKAYITTNLKMMTDPARKTKLWFDEQLNFIRARLEKAQTRLTKYQRQEGIVSSDERYDTESARLQDLSKLLVDAQRETRNAVTERQKLKEVLASEGSVMTSSAIANNPVIQNIKADIRSLESDLVEISSSLGRNHPKHKRIRSELAATNTRLKKEIQSIIDGTNSTAGLASAREADLSRALEKQKQLMLDLKSERDTIMVLKREVDSSQSAYNAALNEMNTTSMQSMVDQTNVSVVDPANVPNSPSSPDMSRNLALGALIGLVLGVGIALLKEMIARKVHSKDDLIREIGVPLLGHLKKV